MRDNNFYTYLHKQIPIIILLSILPGLGYIFLGWLYHSQQPALYWYGMILLVSGWGYRLYYRFSLLQMTENELQAWYRGSWWFFYLFFVLWSLIFIIYTQFEQYNLHYIAVFTQIGASVVASAILYPDRNLYKASIYTLMVPLMIYFTIYGGWVGYVLAAFSATLTWVLLYSSNGTYSLLSMTSYQANHDFLTDLFNRQYFINTLQKKMNTLAAEHGYSYLLLIDLDHFKTVNDSLGHDIGDRLLQEVAHRLQRQLPAEAMVARLGGDEFIITGPNFKQRTQCKIEALKLSEQILETLKNSYEINLHHVYISSSIGASLIDASSTNAVEFIKEADIAMYEVKAKGRDGVFFFDEEMSARVEHNLKIEQYLHHALSNDGLHLHFQPQINEAHQVVGAEALARWTHAELGAVSPAVFIPIAEQTGLIIELGNYILEQAILQLVAWEQEGITLQQFSVNISMRQLMHQNFVPYVESLCRQHLTPRLAHLLIFELTESVMAEDLPRVTHIMQQLTALGISFSMDDFGTGYSSLSYIKQLPVKELKIDRSFIKDIGQEVDAQQMILTILNMARIFKLRIVAEGVETDQQLAFLRQHDCHLVQGFYYSPPLSSSDFIAYYRSCLNSPD